MTGRIRRLLNSVLTRRAEPGYTAARPRFRPVVEGLERRDCPAYWVGDHSSDFADPLNWLEHKPPTPGDVEVYFYGPDADYFLDWTEPDENGDPGKRFPGGACTNVSGSMNEVFVGLGYANTITFSDDTTVTRLWMASGAINQAGHDLTVTGPGWTYSAFPADFYWTGGTLNSGNTAATIHILGDPLTSRQSTATIAPTNGGTVYLGSTLRFAAGVVANIEPGSIDAHNDPDIDMDDCQMAVNTYTVTTNIAIEGVRQINLMNQNDVFTLNGPGTFNPANNDLTMYNHAGAVTIASSGTISLKGQAVVGNVNRNSYYQDGGTLNITSGATLKVANAVQLSGGKLYTLYNPNLADTVAAQEATINGDLFASAGEIWICTGVGNPLHYGTLRVKQAVVLEGTVLFNPYIDGTTSGRCDRILADGNVSVNQLQGSTATIRPSNPSGNNTVANGVWVPIESLGGAYAGTIGTANLQYWAGPPARSFTIGTAGNPVVNKLTLSS